jgi:hypothetical protein
MAPLRSRSAQRCPSRVAMGRSEVALTQNVERLHQAAGSETAIDARKGEACLRARRRGDRGMAQEAQAGDPFGDGGLFRNPM